MSRHSPSIIPAPDAAFRLPGRTDLRAFEDFVNDAKLRALILRLAIVGTDMATRENRDALESLAAQLVDELTMISSVLECERKNRNERPTLKTVAAG